MSDRTLAEQVQTAVQLALDKQEPPDELIVDIVVQSVGLLERLVVALERIANAQT